MWQKLLTVAAVALLVTACESAPGGKGSVSGGGIGSSAGGNAIYDGVETLPGSENVPDRVFFDYDSAVLDAEDQNVLKLQSNWLKANGKVSITVEGHCDERGTREYNLALGERRANAVKNYLVSLGVNPSRVKTISYGKERPAVVGSNETAWAKNRRGVTVVN